MRKVTIVQKVGRLLTTAEAFKIVKKHMLCQNQQSRAGWGCKYRAPDGLRCAVGILIPDDEYDESWDTNEIGLRASIVQCYCPSLKNVDTGMLEAVQKIHDNVSPEHWAVKLSEIEHSYT